MTIIDSSRLISLVLISLVLIWVQSRDIVKPNKARRIDQADRQVPRKERTDALDCAKHDARGHAKVQHACPNASEMESE